MIPLSRYVLLTLVLAVGSGVAQFRNPQTNFLSTAAAQSVNSAPAANPTDQALQPAPAAADKKLATEMVEGSTKGRHLAPHDTFYLLNYVAVRTDTGVEGFAPGQVVHLVEVHRPTHTLVLSDGHAQVEVGPDQLTNDMDIAALARQKDEASQAQIAAHRQAEQAAYAKFEQETAEATAKDLAERKQAQKDQAEELRRQEQTPVARTAPPIQAGADGYYGSGGFGYGSPYSYFSDPSVVVVRGDNGAAPAAPKAAAPSAAGRVNPATIGTAGVARPIH